MKIPERFTGHFAAYMLAALKSGVAPKPYDSAEDGPEVLLIPKFSFFPNGWKYARILTDEESKLAIQNRNRTRFFNNL